MHATTLPISATSGKKLIGAAIVVLVVLGIHPAINLLLAGSLEKILHAVAFAALATGIMALRPRIGCWRLLAILIAAAVFVQYFQLLTQAGDLNLEMLLSSILGGLLSMLVWSMRGPSCR